MNFNDIICSIKETIIDRSPDTLFELYSYNGLGLNRFFYISEFKNNSEKEIISSNLRNKIATEKPLYVISVCIGLLKPLSVNKIKKDKREVLIISVENQDGLYCIHNFYINRNKKKILGLSPAWSYDIDQIKTHNITLVGVLCSWYWDLEKVYSYIEDGESNANKIKFN